MFQMQIENVLKIGNNISVSGVCKNKTSFTNRLVDNYGNEYETYIPLGKDLYFDENIITVCFQGDCDAKSLEGRILKSKENY